MHLRRPRPSTSVPPAALFNPISKTSHNFPTMVLFRVSKSPNEALAMTNCVIVNPRDFSSDVKFVLVEERFIFTIKCVSACLSDDPVFASQASTGGRLVCGRGASAANSLHAYADPTPPFCPMRTTESEPLRASPPVKSAHHCFTDALLPSRP